MNVEELKQFLIDTEYIDFEIVETTDEEIRLHIGVYGESYDCNIILYNERTFSFNFNYFKAMQEIHEIIEQLQKKYYDCFEVTYDENINLWKYTITMEMF